MSAYQIITDSCCDLTDQQLKELNVACVKLTILYKGVSHENFTDEARLKEFYNAMRAGETASTAAANPQEWAQVMETYLAQGLDVLVLTFSSALSTTYQSAVIAGEELSQRYPQRSIRVIDSLSAAHGQGFLVWHACRKRDAGYSLEELETWCLENRRHVCHWVTVDDLSHLKRGGRISATSALVGTMLNIKPIIHMDDEGKLVNVHKVRGRKTAMEYLVQKLKDHGGDYDNETVFISHGDCPEDAKKLEELVRRECGVKEVLTGYVGGVIGSHTGPGVLVVYFLGDER